MDVAAVSLDQLAGDREAEAQSPVPARGRAVQLTERLEDVLDVRRRDAGPVSETKMSTCSPDWRMTGAHLAASRRVLDGVVEDVAQRHPQAGGIAAHPHGPGRAGRGADAAVPFVNQPDLRRGRGGLELGQQILEQRAKLEGRQRPARSPARRRSGARP